MPRAPEQPACYQLRYTPKLIHQLISRDAEGEALYYAWSQVRGSKIALLDVDNAEASFLAPIVSEKRTYRFKLRVTDKKGADSAPAYVDVVVEP